MTNKREWYRKTTWEVSDQEDFFLKLKRCKSDSVRVTKLRIQAFHLAENAELIPHSISILKYSISMFPNSHEFLLAHTMLAHNLVLTGRIEEAISVYKQGIDYRKRPECSEETILPIEFAMFVVNERLTSLFELAAITLTEYLSRRPLLFPIDKFQINGALAIFSAAKGRIAEAETFARIAIDAANLQHSGLQNHPELGLVRDPGSDFYNKVQSLLPCQN